MARIVQCPHCTLAKRGPKTKSPIEKLHAIISSPELVAEIEGYDADQLSARIALCEANVAVSEDARKKDDELAQMVEAAKEAKAPYAEVVKKQRAIQRLCHLMREAKGLV